MLGPTEVGPQRIAGSNHANFSSEALGLKPDFCSRLFLSACNGKEQINEWNSRPFSILCYISYCWSLSQIGTYREEYSAYDPYQTGCSPETSIDNSSRKLILPLATSLQYLHPHAHYYGISDHIVPLGPSKKSNGGFSGNCRTSAQALIASKFLHVCLVLKSTNGSGLLGYTQTCPSTPVSIVHMSCWRMISKQCVIWTLTIGSGFPKGPLPSFL